MIAVPKKVDLLLIVRGLAALAVVFWHISGSSLMKFQEYSYLVTTGRLAVWIFFMLSGYLIGYGFYQGKYNFSLGSLRKFYFNRFLRIYPIFALVYLCAVFAQPERMHMLGSFSFWLREMMAFQWEHVYQLNSVFWTLGIEIQFYLLAPLLIYLQMKTPLGRWSKYSEILWYFLILFSIHLYAESIRHPDYTPFDFRHIFGNFAHFQLGIICARWYPKIKSYIPRVKVYQVWIAALGVCYLVPYMNNSYFRGSIWSIRGIVRANILGALIIFLHIYIEEKQWAANWAVRALTLLGLLSYGLYAWHGFLIDQKVFTDAFALHTASALFLSLISYLLIEKHFIKWKI